MPLHEKTQSSATVVLQNNLLYPQSLSEGTMKIIKRLQFLCYLSSLLLILSSCSSGGSGSSDNTTIGSGDSGTNEGEDVVSSSCIYESIPASNVIFSSDSKMTFAAAKSAGFTKGINVFGINILATTGVSEDKLIHAANILAELIDNDENGETDNSCVVKKLNELEAFVSMYNEDESEISMETLEMLGLEINSTGLGAFETTVNYESEDQHDASVEEIFHLITQFGYSKVYPETFGESNESESLLAKAMDVARGGRQTQIKNGTWTYNNTDCANAGKVGGSTNAWYFYEDNTADYASMITEYIYWAVSSNFGMHASEAGRQKAQTEWCPHTKSKLQEQDPTVYNLINNSEYAFPTSKMPIADYRFRSVTLSDISYF